MENFLSSFDKKNSSYSKASKLKDFINNMNRKIAGVLSFVPLFSHGLNFFLRDGNVDYERINKIEFCEMILELFFMFVISGVISNKIKKEKNYIIKLNKKYQEILRFSIINSIDFKDLKDYFCQICDKISFGDEFMKNFSSCFIEFDSISYGNLNGFEKESKQHSICADIKVSGINRGKICLGLLNKLNLDIYKEQELILKGLANNIGSVVEKFELSKKLEDKANELKLINDKLLQIDVLKSSLISCISHELRTPLTSIIGYLKLFKKLYYKNHIQTNSKLDSRIESYFLVLEEESEKLYSIISDLLDIERIELNSLKWSDELINLEDEIISYKKIVDEILFENNNVQFNYIIEKDVGNIYIDKIRLKLLLMQLIKNSIKYSNQGIIELRVRKSLNNIIFVIEDQGVGIPQEKISMILQPFQKVNMTDTIDTNQGGSGLGLTIVQKIVKHYGGNIEIQSVVNVGTKIIIKIPFDNISKSN